LAFIAYFILMTVLKGSSLTSWMQVRFSLIRQYFGQPGNQDFNKRVFNLQSCASLSLGFWLRLCPVQRIQAFQMKTYAPVSHVSAVTSGLLFSRKVLFVLG
jgi:hypothetical protein